MGASLSTIPLSGLKGVGDAVVTDPQINTTILFITGSEGSVPTSCPAILKAARTSGSLQNFLEIYNLGDQQEILKSAQIALARTNGGGNFGGGNFGEAMGDIIIALREFIPNLSGFLLGLSSPTIDTKQLISSSPEYSSINTYLTTIETSQLPVIRNVSNCLAESAKADPKLLKAAKDNYETSKARYESVTDGNEHVSYYEGWFPITRPLKITTMYVLFALGLIFIILTILIFLSMKGIELKFILPATAVGFSMNSSTENSQYNHYKPYIMKGVGVGALVVVVGMWKKWF